jgi:hypothetical protein
MLGAEIEKLSGKLCDRESKLFEAEMLAFCFKNRQDIVHTLQIHYFTN